MEPSGYSWNRERFFQPLGNPFSRRHSQEKCSYCPQIISWETGIFFNKFKEWSPPSLLHQLELASQVLHGPWKWWKSIGHFFDGCQEFLWCILNRFLWIRNWFWWISILHLLFPSSSSRSGGPAPNLATFLSFDPNQSFVKNLFHHHEELDFCGNILSLAKFGWIQIQKGIRYIWLQIRIGME